MHTPRLVAIGLAGLLAQPFLAASAPPHGRSGFAESPIKHVVVIFDENISFDHYFGTYPQATNPAGEPQFAAAPGTPTVNGLAGALVTDNPNLNPANGAGKTNPFRLDRSQALTADQDHDYGPEQMAFDHGLMDLFPVSVGTAGTPPSPPPSIVTTTGLTMGYYDGNSVTALWNYAQHFAMNDNSYGSNFGPSTVGVLNLVSGQTNGVSALMGSTGADSFISDGSVSGYTVIGDPDPIGDMCSTASAQVTMGGTNIGDLLNARDITWGWFQGGFNLSTVNANGTTGCHRSTSSAVQATAETDYVPHHAGFQYYESTRNEMHVRPASVGMIGQTDHLANHQYDINDFFAAVQNGNMPAVSFLKPIKVQNGHAGNSDPLDEQAFIVHVLNFLQTRPEWDSTVVIIAYDDSDGWYDHQMSPIVNQSQTTLDALSATGQCGTSTPALAGVSTAHPQGRCGYGPRLPLMVISPMARQNFVDHTLTDQSSIIRFIEDNWLDSQRIGSGSFDDVAGPLWNMLDVDGPGDGPGHGKGHDHGRAGLLFLNEQTGEPAAPPLGFKGGR